MSPLETVGFLLVVLFIPFTAVVLVSIAYLVAIYLQSRKPRSWLFRALVRADSIQGIAGVALAYFAIRAIGLQTRTFSLAGLPAGWNTIATVLIAYGLFFPPISQAWTVWRNRRSAGSDVPVGTKVP